jgi:arginine exporter protein ArgO
MTYRHSQKKKKRKKRYTFGGGKTTVSFFFFFFLSLPLSSASADKMSRMKTRGRSRRTLYDGEDGVFV